MSTIDKVFRKIERYAVAINCVIVGSVAGLAVIAYASAVLHINWFPVR